MLNALPGSVTNTLCGWDDRVTIEPEYGGGPFERACATLILVTAWLATDAL